MTPAELIKQAAQELIDARAKALIKGRVRVDSDGDLVCDGISGVQNSVHVIASSGEYVLMEENAEFFALSANRAHLFAQALEKLAGALRDMDCEYEWVNPNSVSCHDKYHDENKCTKCVALREAAEIIRGKS